MTTLNVFTDQAVEQLRRDLQEMRSKIHYLESALRKRGGPVDPPKHFVADVTEEITAGGTDTGGNEDPTAIGKGKAKIYYRQTSDDTLKYRGQEVEVWNATTNVYEVGSTIQIIRDPQQWWVAPAGAAAASGISYQNGSHNEDIVRYGILQPEGFDAEDEHLIAKPNHDRSSFSEAGRSSTGAFQFANSSQVIAATEFGRCFTGKNKPVKLRLPSWWDVDRDRLKSSQICGPLRGLDRSGSISNEDSQAVWPGLPGWRCVAERQSGSGDKVFEFDDSEEPGTSTEIKRFYTHCVREEHAPFPVVAAENWWCDTNNFYFGVSEAVVKFYVKCYSIEYIPRGSGFVYDISHNDMFDTDPDLIYDGHDTRHPEIVHYVGLPCNVFSHAPNIERGMAFMVQPIPSETGRQDDIKGLYSASNQDAPYSSHLSTVPVGSWWMDAPIGTVRMTVVGNRQHLAPGWAICDENNQANYGIAGDWTNRVPWMPDNTSHSQISGDIGPWQWNTSTSDPSDEVEPAGVLYVERTLNCENRDSPAVLEYFGVPVADDSPWEYSTGNGGA